MTSLHIPADGSAVLTRASLRVGMEVRHVRTGQIGSVEAFDAVTVTVRLTRGRPAAEVPFAVLAASWQAAAPWGRLAP